MTKQATKNKREAIPYKWMDIDFIETGKFTMHSDVWSFGVVVVVFPQAPLRVTNVPGHASAGIIQLRNCTLAS